MGASTRSPIAVRPRARLAPRLLAAALALLLTDSTATAASAAPIQPGSAVCTIGGPLDDGACGQWSTLNFVFKNRNGRLFIGSAAHNFGAVGDRAMIRGDSRPFGRVVVDDDSADFLHPGDPLSLEGSDFALIRIRHARYEDVRPRVLKFGGPTGYTRPRDTATGDLVHAFGQGRLDLHNPIGPRSGRLVTDTEDAFIAALVEAGGDSGMPYIHAKTGKALGVNAICFREAVPCVNPTVGYVLRRMRALGFNLRLVRAG